MNQSGSKLIEKKWFLACSFVAYIIQLQFVLK